MLTTVSPGPGTLEVLKTCLLIENVMENVHIGF